MVRYSAVAVVLEKQFFMRLAPTRRRTLGLNTSWETLDVSSSSELSLELLLDSLLLDSAVEVLLREDEAEEPLPIEGGRIFGF